MITLLQPQGRKKKDMGAFDGLNDAKTFDQGNYLGPGNYLLKVTKCLLKDSFASGTCFVTEFEVLESDNPEHKPGSSGSWVQKMTPKDISLPAIKSFIYAVAGADTPDERAAIPCQEVADAAVEKGALNGSLVRAEVIKKTTVKNKKEITIPIFRPAKKAAA